MSNAFNYNQSLCDAALRRYCDRCTEAALGEVHEGMNCTPDASSGHAGRAAATLSRGKGSGKYALLAAHPTCSGTDRKEITSVYAT